jgi:phytoene dehydrogenase-like protein
LLAPLELERHGLVWRADEAACFVPGAPDGRGVLIRRAARRPGESGAADGAHERWGREVALSAALVQSVIDDAPPELGAPSAADLWALAKKAVGLRRLGRREMFALLARLPSSAADWMQDAGLSGPLAAGIVGPALAGSVLGPRAPGTSALVLLREASAGPEPRGGPAGLVEALERACRALEVELRPSAPVRAIRTGDGGVEGVELEAGELVPCAQVASALDPTRTLLGLLSPASIPPALERAARSWRARGTTAVLRLALERPPEFAGREGEPIEHAVSARDLVELERAADALKYRSFPAEPWIEVRVMNLSDPALAPGGQASVAVLSHCVPHALEGGWTDEARERLGRALREAFFVLCPRSRDELLAEELWTPADIERRCGTSGGHIHDGELALDQLWLQRPSLACARYATPVPGLFLCGSGSHPGGPFLGGAGALAARALLAARTSG